MGCSLRSSKKKAKLRDPPVIAFLGKPSLPRAGGVAPIEVSMAKKPGKGARAKPKGSMSIKMDTKMQRGSLAAQRARLRQNKK